MVPESNGRPDGALLAELNELAKRATPPMTPARTRAGFAAVSARLAGRARQPRSTLRLGMLGAGVAAAGAVLWLAVVRVPAPVTAPPVSYRVESGELLDGGYLRATSDRGVRVRFSEGTTFVLEAGARARLRRIDAEGGHLAIEQGRARIEVVERPGGRWVVDAGPFVIAVKGTAFTVAWDPMAEELDVRMEKGLVSVSGPVLEDPLAVRAGQRLSINLPGKQVLLRQLDGAQTPDRALAARPEVGATERPPRAAAAASRARGEGRTPRPAPSPPATSGPFGWAATLAAGDVDSVLGEVERLGAKRALAEASSDDLSALADAARYRRRDDLSRQALLAQRARFAGSARACDAAFLLGRLEEAHEGRGRKALEWYEQYLEGAPTGTYASEALGRKMIATQKMSGKAAARAVAEDYLARFPSGSYAGAARALRQAP